VNLPAIPDPAALTDRARLVELETHVFDALATVTEPELLTDAQRRAAALETYLRGRDGVEVAQGITREIEIRIGELLGEPGPVGTNQHSSRPHADGLERQRRDEFWRLAEAAAADRLPPRPRRMSRRALLEIADRRDRPAVTGVHHCSCAELVDRVEPDTVDVIVTDPPYGREHFDCWVELAEAAPKLLRPGGLVWAMSGQTWLPEVLEILCTGGLSYHWTAAYLTPGVLGQQWNRTVSTAWKPVVVFANGAYEGPWIAADVFRSDHQEGQDHPEGWAQSTTGIEKLVRRASREGDVVCDPFVGSGTVAYAAAELGRSFVGCDVDADLVARLT
jgi:site-specific DNA-methyltransferase (adenine-specific)